MHTVEYSIRFILAQTSKVCISIMPCCPKPKIIRLFLGTLVVSSIWWSTTSVKSFKTGCITGHNDYDAPAASANGESLYEKINGAVTAETGSPTSAPSLIHAALRVTKTMPLVNKEQEQVTEPPFWYPDLKPYAKRMARMRLERRLERIREKIEHIVRWYGSDRLAHIALWPEGCEKTNSCHDDVDCCPGLYTCLIEDKRDYGKGRCVDKLTYLRHLEVAAYHEVAFLSAAP